MTTLPRPTLKAALTTCIPFSFERSIAKVDSMAGDASCTPTLLAAIIASDPLLSAAVIGRARAAAPRSRDTIITLTNAISLLGMSMVQGVVRAVLPIDADWRRTMAAHWALANATATMLRIVVGLCRDPDLKATDEGTLHLCGLLHDLGAIIGQRHFSQRYMDAVQTVAHNRSKTLDQALKESYGLDTTAIGTLVARTWRLPEIMVTCIRYSARPEAATDHRALACAVHVSRTLVRACGFTVPGDPYVTELSEIAMDELGLRYGEIETAIRLFHEDMDELEVYEGVLAH